jgi:hypothetical protein
MTGRNTDPIPARLWAELEQSHETRKGHLAALEQDLGRPVVSFFTSFRFPVSLADKDVELLEGVLQMMDLSKGLAVIISSPGGDALAAERMIHVCRSYSEGDYWAVVPRKAKSAATMVCLGATKILMGPTSELGPIDPQLVYHHGGEVERYSAHNIVQRYNDLFQKAVQTQGNIQPFLQQLANYTPHFIATLEAEIELSKDIAITALESGMMRGESRERIEERIMMFLTPEEKKVHGRPIYSREAAEVCGLAVERVDGRTRRWKKLYELYLRTSNFVSSWASKAIETKDYSFSQERPR